MRRILISAALTIAASAIVFGQAGGQQPAGGNPAGQAAPAIARAQQPEIKVGLPGPELTFERLLQAPQGATADLKSLRGKVTVLEFWATWCRPCVTSFKRLNGVAEKFKDKPVQFIAVTDEDDLPRIRQFMSEVPISGWVALDTDLSTFRAYRVGTRPHTVVLDRDGKIAAMTSPEHVTAAALDDLLAGKLVSLPPKPLGGGSIEEQAQSGGELFQALIQPSTGSGPFFGGMRAWPERIESDGMTLLPAIVTAYGMPHARIIQSVPLSKDMYRVRIRVPKGREEFLHPVFRQALEVTFGLKVHREVREVEVFVLKAAPDKAPQLRPSQATESSYAVWRGSFRGKKQTIKTLAEKLEGFFLEQPVLDETGLTGEYDWELPYNRASNKVLLSAIREQMGLEVVKEKRRIEFLVVDSVGQPEKN